MAEEDTKEPAESPTPKASPEQAAEKEARTGGEAGKATSEEKAKPEAEAAKATEEPSKENGKPSAEPKKEGGKPSEKPAAEPKKEGVKPADKPAVKAEKEEPPEPPKTSNEDTKAFLAESQYYSPEQVEDIRPDIPAFRVPKEKLVGAMRFLRDVLHYEHLACITALDWQKGDLEVVYNLWSYSKNRPVAVRVACTAEDPVVPSVTSVWKGADWLEREEYDLMGIRFEGHPDLRRIMLPEGWRGHPLRKDYEWKKEQFVGMDDEGNDVVYQEAREDAW